MSKTRTEQQKEGEDAKLELQKVLNRFCNVNALTPDFGFDLNAHLMKEVGSGKDAMSDQSFYVQSKSVIDSEDGQIYEDLTISEWEQFGSQKIPVVVFKYDKKNNEFYWEIAQDYVSDVLNRDDPNWRRQTQKRLNFSKKLDNPELFKQTIIEAQKRIIRKGYLGLGALEGLNVEGDDLSELKAHKEHELLGAKAKSLALFSQLSKQGKDDEARKELQDAYSTPGEDVGRVKVIIAWVGDYNFAIHEENLKARKLAEEGIALASKLKLVDSENYLKIQKCEAELLELNHQIARLYISKDIAKATGGDYLSYLYDEEQAKLWSEQKRITEQINNAMKELLVNKHIYTYNAALLMVLRAVAFQIGYLAIHNKKIIEEETTRAPLISQCEFILQHLSDLDMKKLLSKELANYYYQTLQTTKAFEYIDKAIAYAKEDKDAAAVAGYTQIRDIIKARPDPYAHPISKPIDEMSIEEYKEMTRKLIEMQNPEMPPHLLDAAVTDMDPRECFRYCSNLRIKYLANNMVAQMTGAASLGNKILWCKYAGGAIEGLDLPGNLEVFKQIKCKDCKYRNPRTSDWSCDVAWVKEQERDPEFVEFMKKYRENQTRKPKSS